MVEVEVYTNKGCPACVSVKHYLDRKGIDYVEKRLGKSRKTDIEFAVRTKNSKKIPQVFTERLLFCQKAGKIEEQ